MALLYENVCTMKVCVTLSGSQSGSVLISGRFTAGCSPVVDAGGTY